MRIIIFFILGAFALCAHAEDVKDLMSRADHLLNTSTEDITSYLGSAEKKAITERLEAHEIALGQASNAPYGEIDAERAEFLRDFLRKKVDDWARSDAVIIELLETDELNETMRKAMQLAHFYGLDVPKLQKLYALGKKTIRQSTFAIPGKLAPDQQEGDLSFYDRFLEFSSVREEQINRARANTQQYKVVLYKRVTLAFIRALVSASDRPPECDLNKPMLTIERGGEQLKYLDCSDPVVDNLRSYVQAVQKIAEADTDTFAAQAELVIAEQQWVNTLIVGIPLVGDAIDWWSLYTGEDLAGQCLTRGEEVITAVFALVPFLSAEQVSQAAGAVGRAAGSVADSRLVKFTGSVTRQLVNRVGLEDKLARIVVFMADAHTWSKPYFHGIATYFGVTPESLRRFQHWASQDIVVTRAGIEAQQSMVSFRRALKAEEIISQNTRSGLLDQSKLRDLPPSILQRARASSDEIMRKNLRAAQKGRDYAIDQSNMVRSHIEAFAEVAEKNDVVIGFRYVNPNATRLIDAHAATKWMSVKPKSSSWGPHKGYLPFDQNFSKIMDPQALKRMDDAQKAAASKKAQEFSRKAVKCLEDPRCFKMDLVLPHPKDHAVLIWNKGGGVEVPVLKSPDGKLLDGETLEELGTIADRNLRPMEVMAAKNPKGELAPLTADYDLLAVGTKREVQTPEFDAEMGFRTADEQEVVDWVNEAGKKAGYEGGNLSHHGPENQFFMSPGALAEDKVMTMVDPINGITTVPRCDVDCMRQWCATTGKCGSVPLCTKGSSQPCMMVDPDRLLKDYFQNMRLKGYDSLRPNPVWQWGRYGPAEGWPPKILTDTQSAYQTLEGGSQALVNTKLYGQFRAPRGIEHSVRTSNLRRLSAPLTRTDQAYALITDVSATAKKNAWQAVEWLFSCSPTPGICNRVQDSFSGIDWCD